MLSHFKNQLDMQTQSLHLQLGWLYTSHNNEHQCKNWRTLVISQFVLPAHDICAGGPAVPRPRPRPSPISASAPGDTYPPASSSSWTGDLVEEEHIKHSS